MWLLWSALGSNDCRGRLCSTGYKINARPFSIFLYGIYRTKSVTVERALGGGIGGHHGNSGEGEDKDTHNDSKFCDSGN